MILIVITKICDVLPNETYCVKAKISSEIVCKRTKNNLTVYNFTVFDKTGALNVTLFNTKYLASSLKTNEEYIFYGKAESGFNPIKVSEKGAAGLMQIMPETAGYIGEKFFSGRKFDLFLPADNIEAGCFYIFYLSEKFENTTEILAAYNAGEGNVKLWKNEKGAPQGCGKRRDL